MGCNLRPGGNIDPPQRLACSRGSRRGTTHAIAEDMLDSDEIRPLRILGKGAVGVVYAAYHHTLRTPVAIKCIPAAMLRQQPHQLERLRREALATEQLRSRHALRILEYRVDRGSAYIIMELLRGMTLQDALKDRRPLAPAHAVAVVSQVGEVLEEAHSLGMIHRDIKPANVFLVRAPQRPFLKVLDFGIAKWRDDSGFGLTGSNEILGTPAYMSPEHFRGHVDHSHDLWALSALAYRALTGRLPFRGKDILSLATAVLHFDYRTPSSVCPNLNGRVDAWFRRAFAPRVENRFASADELVSSFAQLWDERDRLATMVAVDIDWEDPAPSQMRYAS